VGRLLIPFFILAGLAGAFGLTYQFHRPAQEKRLNRQALAAFEEIEGLRGQVDIRFDHLDPTLFGRVGSKELKDKAESKLLELCPFLPSERVQNFLQVIGETKLPANKKALQTEIIHRLKDMPFQPGRRDLGYSADEGLRLIADRIVETDSDMPILLVAMGHDEPSSKLGRERAEYLRTKLVRFGVPAHRLGAICEERPLKEDADPRDDPAYSWVVIVILE